MKLSQLRVLANQPGGFDIEFLPPVELSDDYAEIGMRATVYGVSPAMDGDYVDLLVDYTKFEEFNKSLEARDYRDKEGNATLTAREAGHYRVKDSYIQCFDPESDELLEQIFKMLDPVTVELNEQFANAGETSYIEWLEKLAAKQLGIIKS
ncbi:hypothetical protein ACYPKM_02230 [Pseudomonas aeruginosa]